MSLIVLVTEHVTSQQEHVYVIHLGLVLLVLPLMQLAQMIVPELVLVISELVSVSAHMDMIL